MRETSVRQFGALTLVFCLFAGTAEAKRIYYQVEGRTYWYDLSEEAAANREAALAAARVLQDRVTQDKASGTGTVQDEAPQASPAARPEPDEVTGAVSRRSAKEDRSRKSSGPQARPVAPKSQRGSAPPRRAARTERPPAPAQPHPAVRAAQPGLARGTAEPQPSATANLQATPQEPATPRQPTPQPETTSSVEAPVSWPELPAPPAPSVVETVTYDFKNGVKRTVLRDGTAYQEAFDPKAFYRFGAAPSNSERPVSNGQAQPDQK